MPTRSDDRRPGQPAAERLGFLRLWAGYRREPAGFYEARDRALAGTGGGMPLDDTIRQYRTGR